MSLLNDYIEEVKKKTKDLKENEIVRYVYLDLGKKFSFDLKWKFGNTKVKKDIYNKSSLNSSIESTLESSEGICKTFAYIVAKVLSSMEDGRASAQIDLDSDARYPHVYNVIIPSNGERYTVDLQADMMNIQSGFRTEYFGLSLKNEDIPVISRDDLEKIDRKLGYIDSKKYYADEYIYLIKSITDGIKDLKSKAEIALLNLEPYNNPNRKYAETKWLHRKIFKELFYPDELYKIEIIDLCKNTPKGKNYIMLIVVMQGEIYDYYFYSNETGGYKKISIEELDQNIKNGIVSLQGIPGIKSWEKNNFNKDFER